MEEHAAQYGTEKGIQLITTAILFPVCLPPPAPPKAKEAILLLLLG